MRTLLLPLALLLGGCFDSLVRPNPGCQSNSDCPSGLCIDVQYFPNELGPGACVPEEQISYVDLSHCDVDNANNQTGARSTAYCQIQPAINDALGRPNESRYIFVLPSSKLYQSFDINFPTKHGPQKPIVVIGPWANPALRGTSWDLLSESEQTRIMTCSDYAVYISNLPTTPSPESVSVTLDGLSLATCLPPSTTNHGIYLQGPKSTLTLRRSRVTAPFGAYGIVTPSDEFAHNRLFIYRSIFDRNLTGMDPSAEGDGGGISAVYLDDFSFVNSLILGPGVGIYYNPYLPSAPNGVIAFSNFIRPTKAVINSMASYSGGVFCKSSSDIDVINSMIIDGKSGCNLKNTFVIDNTIPMPPPLPVFEKSTIGTTASDFKLKVSPENEGCCLDRGRDLRAFGPEFAIDFFGNPRPAGNPPDIGLHEAR